MNNEEKQMDKGVPKIRLKLTLWERGQKAVYCALLSILSILTILAVYAAVAIIKE